MILASNHKVLEGSNSFRALSMMGVLKFSIILFCTVIVITASPIENLFKTQFELLVNNTVNEPFTRNIFVKQIHSHNDYWRDVPLFTALSYGVQSVEADVWKFENDDNLYVGHHKASLHKKKTLHSLYLDPIHKLLTDANPKTKFTDENEMNGVFDTDTSETLYLFIDVKTDGEVTWPFIMDALKPLRDKNWLTFVENGKINYRPVTIIGTGNTPEQYLRDHPKRDYFFDGPLNNLNGSYPATFNPIASASLRELIQSYTIGVDGLTKSQVAVVQQYIDNAHDQGIKTRIWDVNWWPISKRNKLWRQIIELGSDFLNADDLQLASTFY